MIDTQTYQKVLGKILKYTSHARRSLREVTKKILVVCAKMDLPDSEISELIERVVSFLSEAKIVDDMSYAKDFVLQQHDSHKAKSPRLIKQFLLSKGITNSVIEDAIKSLSPSFEDELVLKVAQKKLKSLTKYPENLKMHKLKAYLNTKGFSFDVINRVVDTKIKLN